MSKKTTIIKGISNWEIIAFVLINRLLVGNNPYFSRSEFMTQKNLDFAVKLTRVLNHKENPQHPDKTLQRTIQNLRDQGYIEFLGKGEYKLSKDGVKFALLIEKNIPKKNYGMPLELYEV